MVSLVNNCERNYIMEYGVMVYAKILNKKQFEVRFFDFSYEQATSVANELNALWMHDLCLSSKIAADIAEGVEKCLEVYDSNMIKLKAMVTLFYSEW